MCKDRAIIFILFTLMIDAIGFGIVFPIMPDLMERVGANDTGQGALWGGILMATAWSIKSHYSVKSKL